MSIRLTLRTLLAYFDGQLEPVAAKEIARKLSKSEQAKELSKRMAFGMRNRNLGAPSYVAEAATVDANDVADYLENEVGGAKVARLERQYLEADENLVEVTAVHRILTNVLKFEDLSQLVEVPVAARERVYRFPEVAAGRAVAPADMAEMASEPVPFSTADYSRRGVSLQTAIAGGVVLGAIMTTIAWIAVSRQRAAPVSQAQMAQVEPALAAPNEANTAIDAAGTKKEERETREEVEGASGGAEQATSAEPASELPRGPTPADPPSAKSPPPPPTPQKGKEPEPVVVVAKPDAPMEKEQPEPKPLPEKAEKAEKVEKADFIGSAVPLASFGSRDQILFIESGDALRRVDVGDLVYGGDQFRSPLGARSTLKLSRKGVLDLFDQTIGTLEFAPEVDLRLVLVEGRLSLNSDARTLTMQLGLGGTAITVELQPNARAQMELVNGPPLAGGARNWSLTVWSNSGLISVERAGEAWRLSAGERLVLSATKPADGPSPASAPPDWQLDPLQRRAVESLAKTIPVGADAVGALREVAMTDPARQDARQRATRRFAIGGLAVTGPYAVLAKLLRETRPDLRDSAIEALRTVVRRGDDERREVLSCLIDIEGYSEANAQVIVSMLEGVAASPPRKEDVEPLVTALASRELALRALAIHNLEELTGNNLDYSPDAPDSALDRWQRWLEGQ